MNKNIIPKFKVPQQYRSKPVKMMLRKQILVLILLLGCFGLMEGWAQDTINQDSLSRVIDETVQREMDKANRKKKKKIRFPRWKDTKDSTKRPFFERAKEFVENIEVAPVRDIINLDREEYYPEKEVLDSSLQAMEEVLKEVEETDDTATIILLQEAIGAVHQMGGNNSIAREAYQKNLEIAEEAGDLEGIARAKFNLANSHFKDRQYNRARRLYYESMGIYEELDTEEAKKQLSVLYVNLGKCLQSLGQQSEALVYFNKAVETVEENNDKEDSGYAYQNLGRYYQEQKDWSKAMEFHKKALEDYDKMGRWAGKGRRV